MQAILVTGMHRSGTSAVAQLIIAAGAYAGSPEHHMTASIENPAGFAELREVMDFNDSALAARGWAWDTPPAFPVPDPPHVAQLIAHGRSLIEHFPEGLPSTVLKDPRLCLLMPLWRKILLDRFVVVFAIRPPIETAWSLAVRDGFSMSLGLALWSAYYRHLFAGMSGMAAIGVDYVALIERPLETTRLLLDAIRALGVHLDADAEVAAAAIQPVLRRSTVPTEVESASPGWVVDSLVPGWSSASVHIFKSFDLAAPPPLAWEVDVLDGHRARRELNQLAERERAAASSLSAERDALSTAIEDAVAQLGRQHQESSRRDGLETELALMAKQLDSTREELDRIRRLVSMYESSRSWRLTAPLRAAGRAVRRLRGSDRAQLP